MKHSNSKFYMRLTIILVCSFSHWQLFAQVTNGTDESTKLPFWELNQGNVTFRLVQRLPDQSRGFFEARGFKKPDAELIAQSCVFQTIIKNNADATSTVVVSYDASDWRIENNGQTRSLILREEWEKIWHKRKVSEAAKIAFEWALIPTKQRYLPQDYNWGMTLYGLAPGSKFNLKLTWSENGKQQSASINDITCAPDIHPDPEKPFG